MKRINNLYHKIYEWDNLWLADEKARKGKKDTYGVMLHDRNREANLRRLQDQLINKTYKNPPYEVHTVYHPKERQIYKIPYIHRVLHHAIMNVLEPIWVSIFTADTYNCIKGRGIHSCMKKVRNVLQQDMHIWDGDNWNGLHAIPKEERPKAQHEIWERQYFNELPTNNIEVGQKAVVTWRTQYALKLDIRKFYPSIDHDILKGIVRLKIKDKDLLWLLDEIIDSAPGVPIGNYLSQYFANLYLAYFDHWVKEVLKVEYFYRYADDIVVLSHSKEYLHEIFMKMKAYLADNLKLVIKPDNQVFPIHNTNGRGLDFVGYQAWHTHVLLRKGIKIAFDGKMNSNIPYKDKVAAWWSYMGWASHCNSKNLIQTIDEKYKLFQNEQSAQNTHLAPTG